MAGPEKRTKGSYLFLAAVGGVGALIGIWAMAALTYGLSQSGWSFGEMLRQYLVAVGAISEHETLVDFYTHIKGIEYIICVAFFVAFPVFFKYVNKEKTKAPLKTK
jgi:Na+/H+ antiporter NhaC